MRLDTGELHATPAAIDALLADERPVLAALHARGLGEAVALCPGLVAACATARGATFHLWVEGLGRDLAIDGGPEVCAVRRELAGGRGALLPVPVAGLVPTLAAALGLGPRPVPSAPAVALAVPAMAVLLGRRQAFGHGLPHDTARTLQAELADTRHWTLRLIRTGWDGVTLRRNVEVVDGPNGAWRVRPQADGRVRLTPVSTTDLVRALVGLVGLATGRRPLVEPDVNSGPRAPSP